MIIEFLSIEENKSITIFGKTQEEVKNFIMVIIGNIKNVTGYRDPIRLMFYDIVIRADCSCKMYF